MRLQFWAADTLRFSVTGPEPHRFLNRAAAAGVRLRRVRWQRDGYAATAGGTDRRRLERIARDGGWTLAVTTRRGPGRHTERLLQTRPGLAAGAVLFLLLVRALGGLVWCIDFGAMDPGLQPAMRRLLADCGIHEGVLLTKPLLQTAQAQALRRSEVFGWVSLNFTGGCLAIESTPSQTQTVREPSPRQGLYASADGEILAVEIESGFAAVTVGQTVARGQLLAAAERLDRKGNAVPQGADGRVIARVQKHYTASQSLTAEASVYTGRSSVQATLYLPWRSYTDEPEDPLTRHHADRLAARAAGPPGAARQPLPRDDLGAAAGHGAVFRGCRRRTGPARLPRRAAGRVPGCGHRGRAARNFRAGRHRNGSCDLYFHRQHRRTAVIRHILLSMTKWLIKFCAIFIVSFAKNCDII